MTDEKQQLKEEIQKLKEQQAEMRQRIKEIEQCERLKEKERQEIASRLKNKDMLDCIFKSYDNVKEYGSRKIEFSGKVVLRHKKYMPNEFTKIRDLSRAITDYVTFSRRKDNYVEWINVSRKLNQLDDVELDLVTQCADEIIAVLYKYKQLCEKHQNRDDSEFVIEIEEEQ